jgi:hypothetical protein
MMSSVNIKSEVFKKLKRTKFGGLSLQLSNLNLSCQPYKAKITRR